MTDPRFPAARAVIFDLDGTLLDTIAGITEATNIVLAREGLPPLTEERFQELVGDGLPTLIRRAVAPHPMDEAGIMRLTRAMRAEYPAVWPRSSAPFPGVVDALSSLTDRGIPLAILSNKPDGFTREMTSRLLPATPFVVVRGSVDEVTKKPSPGGALAIAQTMGVAPEAVIFVGDSDVDMDTAVNAAMIPVGVTWGFRPEAELLDHGARAILHHPDELAQLL